LFIFFNLTIDICLAWCYTKVVDKTNTQLGGVNLMTIIVCEYKFEVSSDNHVKVFDTSLNKYVGYFENIEPVLTKDICEKWLDLYYGW
jgi:hypothetical protein